MGLTEILLIVLLSLIGLILIILLLPFIFKAAHKVKNDKNKYNKISKSSKIRLINQLRESVEYLSKTKTGALITIENKDSLDNLRTDGIKLEANISSALIISIFNKKSPLHDEAIIIREDKILYASTYYKITRK